MPNHVGDNSICRHLMEDNAVVWRLGDSICLGVHTSFATHSSLPIKGVPDYGGANWTVGNAEPFNNTWCTHSAATDVSNNTAPADGYTGAAYNFVGDWHSYKFPVATTTPASDGDIFGNSRIHGFLLHTPTSNTGFPEDYFFRQRISGGIVKFVVYYRYNAGPTLCIRAIQPEVTQNALRFDNVLGTIVPDGTLNLRKSEFTIPAPATAYDGTKNLYAAICGPMLATAGTDGVLIVQRTEFYNPALTGVRYITCGGSNAQTPLYSNTAILSDAAAQSLLSIYQPTVISLEAGLNDGRGGASGATIQARLLAVIDRFRGFDPTLRFILRSNFFTQEITQAIGSGGTSINGVWHYGSTYNAQVACNAAYVAVAGLRSKVYYCDAAGGNTPVFFDLRYTTDTLHPSGNNGDNMLMAGFGQGIQAGYGRARGSGGSGNMGLSV